MPKLKNGQEVCDKCNKPYIALLNGESCKCEIVVEHKGLEKETAAVLKWKKRAEVAEEALAESCFIVRQFSEWYSDNGCPVTETKEGFCPDPDGYRAEHEKRNLQEAEEDRFDFDSSDCESQINCGKCYAEYYRKLYKDKQTKGE